MFLFPTHHAQAANITLNGSSADSATITNKQGENVTGQTLNRWESYSVTYHWSIPDGTTINAGDTAQFEIPSDITILKDTNFNVVDQDGHVIGTFHLPKDGRTGTLTFNDYISNHPMTDINGTLTVAGNGIEDIGYKDWVINKTGWVNDQEKPTWDIVYNPDSNHLSNVTITDTLEGAQVIDSDSIVIQYGYVDENNQFHMESEVTNPVENGLITVTDKGFVANLGTIDKAVQIVYTTSLTSRLNANVSNSATGSSDQLGSVTDGSTIYVGGSGTVSGSSDNSTSESSTTNIPWYPIVPATTTSETESTTTTTENTNIPWYPLVPATTSSSDTETTTTTHNQMPWYPLTPASISSTLNDTGTTNTTQETGGTSSTTSSTPTSGTTPTSNSSNGPTSVVKQATPKTMQDTVFESVHKTNQQAALPQTGDKKQYGLMMLGGVIIIGVIAAIAWFIYHKRHHS